MGLAFSSISSIGAPTFIENLASQGAVLSSVFSMYLSANNSELYLGGTNSSLYNGNITYTDLSSRTYWLTNGSSSVGGTEAYNGPMIIDSGTTLIVGEKRSVEAWWEQVDNASRCPSFVCGASGYYLFPCSSPPNVTFAFGGASYSVNPNYLSSAYTITFFLVRSLILAVRFQLALLMNLARYASVESLDQVVSLIMPGLSEMCLCVTSTRYSTKQTAVSALQTLRENCQLNFYLTV
jgi:hypothetical protein